MGVKIMIIDDEVEDLDVQKKYAGSLLENKPTRPKYEFCFVANGAAAIQILRKEKKNTNKPKLIILDQQFTYGSLDVEQSIEKWWKKVPYDGVGEEEYEWNKEVLLSDSAVLGNSVAVQQGLVIIKALKHEMAENRISETPILFCSSQEDDTDTMEKAIELGAEDHVSKNNFSDLSGVVDSILMSELYSGKELAEKLLDQYGADKNIIFQKPARIYLVKKCSPLNANEMEEIVRLLCGNIALATEQTKISVTLNTAKKAFGKATAPQGEPQIKKKINDGLKKAFSDYFNSKTNPFDCGVRPFFDQIVEEYLPKDNYEGCYINCGKILEQIAAYAANHKLANKINKQFRANLGDKLSAQCCDLYSERCRLIHGPKPITIKQNACVNLIQGTFCAVREFSDAKSYS